MYLVRLETQPEGVAGEKDDDDENQDEHGLLVALHSGLDTGRAFSTEKVP